MVLTDAFGEHVDVADGEHGDGPRPNDRSPWVTAGAGAVRPGTECRAVVIVAGGRVQHAGVKTLRSHLGGMSTTSVRCSLRS